LRAIFAKLTDFLSGSSRKVGDQSKFVDLAPTDKADEDGVYSEALLFAITNPRVSNIALTGPYGSGKSSIIRTFLGTYRRSALHISLAAFLPEADSPGGKVSRQEIERSILQQLLYGADANKLPFSRFKRIQHPGMLSIFKSLYIALGVLALWHLVQEREAVLSGSYFLPFSLSNWFNLACFVIGGSFLWAILHKLYVASFGVSLKSISLKDIEIRPESDDQESILNRHLDEIIYFFQSTKYELVVIEDLDRFNNTDIFITLREINGLVNSNSGVRRRIRFLYALRDDMFVNTDRTKFFEFIIPVIPIINSSNSIDKVLEQGKRLSLHDRLDRQFLREASRYLNDLRLIQNIFNEYAIYAANLETDGDNVLDANKLLAVLIYKNVYPKDFEDLHQGSGNLADILARHDDLIASGEAKKKSEISHLEKQIERADRELASNLQELRKIYAMAIVEKLSFPAQSIGPSQRKQIKIASLAESELFDQLIETPKIVGRHINNNQTTVDISGLQAEVNPNKTYEQRKNEIRHKSADFKTASLKKIRDLRTEMSMMRTVKFNEIVRLSAGDMETLFEKFGENGDLARFLIFEGYLDDTYYQYTSLFHSGRLSPNDNKFLIQIRGFRNPEPDFQIDNPREVIAAMRSEDFRQNYALNIKIVNCLLSNGSKYEEQKAKLFEFIASDFDGCQAFFKSYYATGTEVPNLIFGLVKNWKGLIPAAINSTNDTLHIAHIIAHLPAEALEKLRVKNPEISSFVSSNVPNILSMGIDFELEQLKRLEVEVDDLAAIENYPTVTRFLFEEGLYQINISNMDFIFIAILGKSSPEALLTQHYTTILKTENASLISRIEREFETYLQEVLLRLDDNSQESALAILSVIQHDEVELDEIREFLEKQVAMISSLDQAPTRLHGMLFQLAKVEPTWDNCLAFINSENYESEILIDYLNLNSTQMALSRLPIPGGDEAYSLRAFLIEADSLQDDAYRKYVRELPRPFKTFPKNLDADKLRIVVDEQKVSFSESNLASLGENIDLKVLFVSRNIKQYLKDQDSYQLDDDFREKLLASEINDEFKLEVIQSMDLVLLPGLPDRAAIIGPILDRTNADLSSLGAATARAVIANSAPISVQISLFNKYQSILSGRDIREILATLPKPYSEITTGYHIPKVEKSEVNIQLVEWLEARGIISSWSEMIWSDRIRVNLKRS